MNIAILGSTGSIGHSTLEVIRQNKNDFSINLLTAKTNHKLLIEQCKEFDPAFVYVEDEQARKTLERNILDKKLKTCVIQSLKEFEEIIGSYETDVVVAGMVGIAGLMPVHIAIQKGKKVLLANKESYVVAGEYLNNLCKETGATIFPIDSEHSAIHQCLDNVENKSDVSRIILTGSGGPFLNKNIEEFSSITPEQAINHPVWNMGKKISVDSSTLMNKGLEVIEARWLFDSENIEILIHPEGIIHSLVELKDNSVLAQLSNPDMKIPIAYGLGYPNRINSGSNKLNLHEIKSLHFQEPDFNKFPCLKLAIDLLSVGGTSFSILNATNEECVTAFLDGRIGYIQIHEIISKVLDRIEIKTVQSLQDIYESDKASRLEASSIINNI
tara:strand:+ start:2115 stop:3269 length:1155 start_codon:yes stop_codon:yes gene_type:complete